MLNTELKVIVNRKLMISTHTESEFSSTKPHINTYFSTALLGGALVTNLHTHGLVSNIFRVSQCNLWSMLLLFMPSHFLVLFQLELK